MTLADQYIASARAFVAANRIPEAMKAAEAAVRLSPDNPFFTHFLGAIYKRMRIYENALPLLRHALSKRPDVYLIQSAMAEWYFDMGQGSAAARHFEHALALCSDTKEQVRLRVGIMESLALSGKTADAKAAAEALKTSNQFGRIAAARELVNLGKDGTAGEAGQYLMQILAEPDLRWREKAVLLLALGRLHERDGNHDLAFATWKEARALQLAERPQQRDCDAAFLVSTTFYTPEFMEKARPHGHDSNSPIFIVGMPRSGTTLLEQIIAAHSQVAGVGERGRINRLDQAFRQHFSIVPGDFTELRRSAENLMGYYDCAAGQPIPRIVEKTPHHFLNVGFILACFPNARIVHCRRHALDTFISSYQHNFRSSLPYVLTQESYFAEYLLHEKIMNYWQQGAPGQILSIDYEDLVSDPESLVKKLIGFVGLDWEDSCLKHFDHVGTVRTFSSQQVRQPIHAKSIGRWKNYEHHLAPLILLCQEKI